MNDKFSRRNSFNRFGDDLCEYILSYLRLNDCFKYEAVSKQWKRVIYNKQNTLTISGNGEKRDCIKNILVRKESNEDVFIKLDINNGRLKHVLNKCGRINNLVIYEYCEQINDNTLVIISNNCPNLKSFVCYPAFNLRSYESLNLFADKFGQSLERIIIMQCNSKLINVLVRRMTNLNHIYFGRNLASVQFSVKSFLNNDDNYKKLLPKLQKIDLKPFGLTGFELFAEMYCKQIRKLSINLVETNGTCDALTLLAGFINIEKLELNFNGLSAQLIETGLKLIGEKCTKLIELDLTEVDGTLSKCFVNNFGSLKVLALINFDKNLIGGYKSLTNCIDLKYLTLMFRDLTDVNFIRIDDYLPNLKYLHIHCRRSNITDETLRSLMKLKRLCCLVLKCSANEINQNITDVGVCDLINKCISITTIKILIKTKITQKSMDEFVDKARLYGRKQFHFSILISENSSISVKNPSENLCVNIYA